MEMVVEKKGNERENIDKQCQAIIEQFGILVTASFQPQFVRSHFVWLEISLAELSI